MADAQGSHPKSWITLAVGTPEQEAIKAVLHKMITGRYGTWNFNNLASVYSVVNRASAEVIAALAALDHTESEQEHDKPKRGRPKGGVL